MKLKKKIVLAYSGGLDTSIILKWLQENYNSEVIAYTADIGQEIDKKKILKNAKTLGVTKVIIENLKRNLFHLCHRGGGNYSYRFYEILMMGRIPIFINTECVLPFEDKIKLEDISILIDEKDLTEDKKFHYKGSSKNFTLKYEKNLDSHWTFPFSIFHLFCPN